jgi:PIN domain nuclease of toxin-antitoxin system
MNYLLDTHTLLWFFGGDKQISTIVKDLIENPQNHKLISIATVWEMSIKQSQGKLHLGKLAADYVADKLIFCDFQLLPIELKHLKRLSSLELFHRDPFDRLIISQASTENLPILTKDQIFKSYPIKCIW